MTDPTEEEEEELEVSIGAGTATGHDATVKVEENN